MIYDSLRGVFIYVYIIIMSFGRPYARYCAVCRLSENHLSGFKKKKNRTRLIYATTTRRHAKGGGGGGVGGDGRNIAHNTGDWPDEKPRPWEK